MGPHEPFNDPVLGRVVWDVEHRWWRFEVTLESGRMVRGIIDPSDEGLLEDGKGLDAIRELVSWVVRNEPAIRQRITEAMFEGWRSGWYDEEIDDVTTPDEFRKSIALAGMDVHTVTNIGLTYSDGNLFGGHSIVLSVDAEGRFVYEPNIWG